MIIAEEYQSRKSSARINVRTKTLLQEWDRLHSRGRKRSYEEIITTLLERDKNKSNAFFNLNLPVVDRFILTLIEDGVKTSKVILARLKKENFNLSLRSLQSHLEYLSRGNLIIRKRKEYGNEYEYFILNYQKALD